MKFIGKYQEGGPMPPAGGDPAAQGGGDPMQEILAAAQSAVEGQDCQIALQVCEVLMQMAGGGAEGGAPAPEEAAPAPAEEPVYAARGAKLLRRIRK